MDRKRRFSQAPHLYTCVVKALFPRALEWKRGSLLPIGESEECSLSLKWREIPAQVTAWMSLGDTMVSDTSQEKGQALCSNAESGVRGTECSAAWEVRGSWGRTGMHSSKADVLTAANCTLSNGYQDTLCA